MKILTVQTTAVTEGPFAIHEQRSAVHHEVAPGTFVHLAASSGGITVWRGKTAVNIPFDNIMALALAAEPSLGTPDPLRRVIVDKKP